jgi:fucose permease
MTSPLQTTQPDVRSRNAVLAVFGANGFMFASWASRVPDAKAALSLTPGRLSLLLLAISVGSVVGLPLAGRLTHRLGAATGVRLGTCVATPGAALGALTVQAHGPFAVAAAGLFLLGLGIGIADVAQNIEGTVVEQSIGKAIMPWFHAAYSLGTVGGALLGAVATQLRIPVGVHVTAAAIATLVTVVVSSKNFTPKATAEASEHQHADRSDATIRRRSAWLEPRTLLIGVMVLAAAFTEGSANDWMAVGFVDGHHVTKALGVVAFAVFLTCMTIGRIFGTRLLNMWGRVAVLRTLFVLAILGCALVVFGPTWLAYAGAVIWGVGASLGFPVGMSAAADDPQRAAMRISTVATIGYLAFLAGPPLLGFLGDQFGILHALLAVGAVSLLALLVVPVAEPPTPIQ